MTEDEKAAVRRLIEAAKPFLDWRIVDDTSGTDQYKDELASSIEAVEQIMAEGDAE